MIIRTYHMVVPKILIFSAVVSLISLMMGIVTGTLALKKKGLRLWHKMQYITKCNISRANQSFFTVEIFSIYVFHIAFSSRRLGSLVERPQIMRLSQTSFRLVSLVASHAYESFGNFVRGLCYAWMFSAEKSIIYFMFTSMKGAICELFERSRRNHIPTYNTKQFCGKISYVLYISSPLPYQQNILSCWFD